MQNKIILQTRVRAGASARRFSRGSMRLTVLVLLLVAAGTLRSQTTVTDVAGLNAISTTGSYIITANIDASSYTTKTSFTGTLEAAIDPATHMPYRITTVGRNHGGKVGRTLSVTISSAQTTGGQTKPAGATITTSVFLEDHTHILGDVFGGGDQGPVGGNSEVTIKD